VPSINLLGWLKMSSATFLGWLNRKGGTAKREIVRQLKAAKALPCCDGYSVPAGYVSPADSKAKPPLQSVKPLVGVSNVKKP